MTPLAAWCLRIAGAHGARRNRAVTGATDEARVNCG